MEIFSTPVKGEGVGLEFGARVKVGVGDRGCSEEGKGVRVKVRVEVTVFTGGLAVGIKGSGNCLVGLGARGQFRTRRAKPARMRIIPSHRGKRRLSTNPPYYYENYAHNYKPQACYQER